MTITELLESVPRIEVRTNRAFVAAGIRACRKEPRWRSNRRNIREAPAFLEADSGRQDAALYVKQGCLTLQQT